MWVKKKNYFSVDFKSLHQDKLCFNSNFSLFMYSHVYTYDMTWNAKQTEKYVDTF